MAARGEKEWLIMVTVGEKEERGSRNGNHYRSNRERKKRPWVWKSCLSISTSPTLAPSQISLGMAQRDFSSLFPLCFGPYPFFPPSIFYKKLHVPWNSDPLRAKRMQEKIPRLRKRRGYHANDNPQRKSTRTPDPMHSCHHAYHTGFFLTYQQRSLGFPCFFLYDGHAFF